MTRQDGVIQQCKQPEYTNNQIRQQQLERPDTEREWSKRWTGDDTASKSYTLHLKALQSTQSNQQNTYIKYLLTNFATEV